MLNNKLNVVNEFRTLADYYDANLTNDKFCYYDFPGVSNEFFIQLNANLTEKDNPKMKQFVSDLEFSVMDDTTTMDITVINNQEIIDYNIEISNNELLIALQLLNRYFSSENNMEDYITPAIFLTHIKNTILEFC